MNTAQFIRTVLEQKSKLIIVLIASFIVSLISFFAYNNSVNSNQEVTLSFYLSSTKYSNPDEFLNKGDVVQTSSTQDVDRLNTFISSSKLKDHLIEKFNLIEHYNVDIGTTDHYSKLYQILDQQYVFVNTKYKLKYLKIRDKDKDFAIELGKEVIAKASDLSNDMLIEGKEKQLTVCEKQIKYYQNRKSELNDSALFVKDKILKQGFKFNNVSEFKSDITSMSFFYDKYKISSTPEDQKLKNYYKSELDRFSKKYNIGSYKKFGKIHLIKEELELLNEIKDQTKTIQSSIENYKRVKENLKLATEMIQLDQPTITSIKVENKQFMNRPMVLFISFLLAIYITLMYIVGIVQFNKWTKYISAIQKSN